MTKKKKITVTVELDKDVSEDAFDRLIALDLKDWVKLELGLGVMLTGMTVVRTVQRKWGCTETTVKLERPKWKP